MNSVRSQGEKPKDRRRWHFEKGQSAYEFAGVLFILVPMLVVIADFGRIFFITVAVNNAARAGAQYGSQTNTTAADSASVVAEASADGANIPNFGTPTASQCTCGADSSPSLPACSTLSSTYCADTASKVHYVIVNTSATFTTLLNYPGFQHSFTLTGKAIMQVQEQ